MKRSIFLVAIGASLCILTMGADGGCSHTDRRGPKLNHPSTPAPVTSQFFGSASPGQD